MRLRKLLTLGLIAFAIFFVVSSPAEAARLVKVTGENAGDWAEEVAESLSKFLKTLI